MCQVLSPVFGKHRPTEAAWGLCRLRPAVTPPYRGLGAKGVRGTAGVGMLVGRRGQSGGGAKRGPSRS